jgi:hypothetical protein
MSFIRSKRTIDQIINEGVVPSHREFTEKSIEELATEYGEVRQWLGMKESNHPATDHLDQYILDYIAHAYHGALVRRIGLADEKIMAKEQAWQEKRGGVP